MARPYKLSIEYFPHTVDSADNIILFTLEEKYGNSGYAFWFKLLEILGKAGGRPYYCQEEYNWLYLAARMHMQSEEMEDILATLAKLQAIDQDLWQEHRIIWVQSFVDSLKEIYRKRALSLPVRPEMGAEFSENSVENSTVEKSRVEKSRVEKSKAVFYTSIARKKQYYAEYVQFTPAEYDRLVEKLGTSMTVACTEILNEYKGSTGREYKSDYHAIFSWVVLRYRQNQEKNKKLEQKKDDYQKLLELAGVQEGGNSENND